MKNVVSNARLVLLTLVVALLISGNVAVQAAGDFGFCYCPAGYGSEFLMPNNWTTSMKNTVKTDLDQMSSMGAKVIRFNIGSGMGWYLSSGNGPGGSQFTSDFYDTVNNWVEFLGMINERDLKIIPLCANYYNICGPSQGVFWWMNFYGNTDAGFSNFLSDTLYYYDAFFSELNTNYPNIMPYCDYVGEYCTNVDRIGWYARFMFDWLSVPTGKKGCSVMRASEDGSNLYWQLQVGGSRTLDYTAFSCYPTLNEDVASAYNTLDIYFPNAEIGLNETGYSCPSSGYETAQNNWVTSKFGAARNLNMYRMNWGFLDNSNVQGNDMGWAYNRDSPKDAYGSMISAESMCYNPDMEIISGGVPAGWSYGCSDGQNTSFYALANAATNTYCARLCRTATTGSAWIVSSAIAAVPGKRIFVNSYLRTSGWQNLYMAVAEYDSSGWGQVAFTVPAYMPNDAWYWRSYLGTATTTWSKVLTANTAYVRISFGGSSVANPAYLDVDAVSVSYH